MFYFLQLLFIISIFYIFNSQLKYCFEYCVEKGSTSYINHQNIVNTKDNCEPFGLNTTLDYCVVPLGLNTNLDYCVVPLGLNTTLDYCVVPFGLNTNLDYCESVPQSDAQQSVNNFSACINNCSKQLDILLVPILQLIPIILLVTIVKH